MFAVVVVAQRVAVVAVGVVVAVVVAVQEGIREGDVAVAAVVVQKEKEAHQEHQ